MADAIIGKRMHATVCMQPYKRTAPTGERGSTYMLARVEAEANWRHVYQLDGEYFVYKTGTRLRTPLRFISVDGLTCQWFGLCDNPATTTRDHPTLGPVPICDRCNTKLKDSDNA
jgi:hypothetical protein